MTTSQNKPIYLTARVLMSSIFLVAGIRKLLSYGGTAGFFGMLGIPFPDISVGLIALVEIGGGLALITGWRTRQTCWVLAAFTLVAGLLAHQFWAAEAAQFNNQLNHFLKNIAMVGGFLAIGAMDTSEKT